MHTKLAGFTVFLVLIMMVTPAYASVTSLSLEKSFYTNVENFKFVGTQNGTDVIFVIIRGPTGNFQGMLSDPTLDEGEFDVIPRPVENFFSSQGIYNATAFSDSEKEEDGFTIQIEYDGNKIFEVPSFVLQLNQIADVTVDELKTVSFTVSITDSSMDDVVYSLEKNPPNDATINSSTGQFVWTPSSSHGNSPGAQYTFDIVVTKGSQVDRESITITVNEPVAIPPEPKPEPEPEPKTTSEPKELGLAPFVDESKDPQSYVDRYNSEASYKKWFDDNYSEYSSIYEAVGLEEPKVLAPFVDPNLDPQYYIDRYNDEITYKDWFDKTYPDMTIYEAVGLEEPEIKEPEFGECGEGTKLIDGKCTVVASTNEVGGCLIATAAYGSEMAPQVQFLREIRDNQLMDTASGVSFMTGFNQLYYSFSPYIADLQRENPAFKEMVKIGITPLLSTLSIMSFAESDSEVLGYGIGVILLNIGMYFVAPAMLFYGIRKVRLVRF